MTRFGRLKFPLNGSAIRIIQAFYQNRRAVTAIEYAMIAGVITVAIVSSLLVTVGPSLNHTFAAISAEL